MARIQILHLPPYGRDGEDPFALIVDQCTPAPRMRYVTGTAESPEQAKAWQDVAAEHNANLGAGAPDVSETEQERWGAFAEAIGARAVIFTCHTVDIADDTADPAPTNETHFHLADATLDQKRLESLVQRQQQRGGER